MTTFINHQTMKDSSTMRKITAQICHTCAETGESIKPGMVVYYEDETKKYFCLNSETVKKFLLGDDIKANEEND